MFHHSAAVTVLFVPQFFHIVVSMIFDWKNQLSRSTQTPVRLDRLLLFFIILACVPFFSLGLFHTTAKNRRELIRTYNSFDDLYLLLLFSPHQFLLSRAEITHLHVLALRLSSNPIFSLWSIKVPFQSRKSTFTPLSTAFPLLFGYVYGGYLTDHMDYGTPVRTDRWDTWNMLVKLSDTKIKFYW